MYLAAIVLAGGRSSRLGGVSKAGLLINGQTLLGRTLDAVSQAQQVIIVGEMARSTDAPASVLVTREDPPFSGPAAAIAAGLDALQATVAGLPDFVLVLACDMPGVADVVTELIAAATGELAADSQGAIAIDEQGQRQFLAGVYRPTALRHAVEQVRASGPIENLSVKRLLDSLTLTDVLVPTDATADIDTWEQAGAFGISESSNTPPSNTPPPNTPPPNLAPRAVTVPEAETGTGTQDEKISWRDARLLAAATLRRNEAESVQLPDALGRVLAADLRAQQDVPHYPSAAMDGWAVAGTAPWRIVNASDINTQRLESGTAVPILTGGLLPQGATAVLRSELVMFEPVIDGHHLQVSQDARPGEPFIGQHIRPAGEEAQRGETLIAAGTTLNPAHIAVAAMAGYDALGVIARPRVRFMFTGDEVDESGIPAAGRVRDAFGPQLPGLLRLMGAEVLGQRRAADTLTSTTTVLRASIADAQLVISTGGTGHSSADHLREALHAVGARVLFDGISMRPGGPTLLAEAPNGCLVVCLPGNPLAALIGLMSVVEPMVRAASGLLKRELHEVVVDSDLAGRSGTTILIPYTRNGSRAHPSDWRGSAMMRGLADAHGVIEVTEHGLVAGDHAWALTLPWM